MANRIQQRKVYSFKSVGELTTEVDKIDKSLAPTPRPIGIKTPVQLAKAGTGLFTMNTSLKRNIQDNLRNLLTTNWGERLGLYDYGANLEELAFRMGTENGSNEAVERINIAISKWMPFITPNTFEPLVEYFDNKEVAKIGFRITYDVPKAGISNQIIEVLIYAAG